jgi:hypothetical protein
MNQNSTRRQALASMAILSVASTAGAAASPSATPSPRVDLLPDGAKTLRELSDRLARTPRRRDFKTVPMILTSTDEWDSDALSQVIAYRGGPKQAFDNTDLEGPWLNLMRNSMNAQAWSWKHPDFLCVSATHGSAHYALYDDWVWDKYQLAKLTKGKFESNVFTKSAPAAAADPKDFEKADGVFSPDDNSIAVLQRRGAVFIACHNQVWEMSGALIRQLGQPGRPVARGLGRGADEPPGRGRRAEPGCDRHAAGAAGRRLHLREVSCGAWGRACTALKP